MVKLVVGIRKYDLESCKKFKVRMLVMTKVALILFTLLTRFQSILGYCEAAVFIREICI